MDMVRRKGSEVPNSKVISGATILDSTALGWQDLALAEWQGVPPQEAYEKELAKHLIVIHTTPQPVRVFERADNFRTEGVAHAGDVNLLSSGEEAFCRWDQPLSFIRLELSPSYLRELAQRIDYPRPDQLQVIHSFHARDMRILQITRWLLEELRNGGIGGKLFADSLLHLLAVHLLRYYTGLSVRQLPPVSFAQARQPVARAIEYMHANLDQPLSLKEVGEAAHISPSHLLRIFKRATGSSLHQFLIRLRVNRARELLLAGNASIADVAAEVGFADQSHLTRHFKRLMGTTPKKILHDLK